MFQAVAVERRNVEDAAVLTDIVKDIVDAGTFREIIESRKYLKQIDVNNDLAYQFEGVWAVPAFRMRLPDGSSKKLDAQEGVGVTKDALRDFLKR
jgi:predicted DsbA family dithiol-disulfide isomerase